MPPGFTVADPRFPWIGIRRHDQKWLVVLDERTGHTEIVTTSGVADFIARHSAAQGHDGLGDLVRSITKKLGFGACEPCAKRQAALNGAMPKVYRRR